jgi:hypothetical protein
MRPTVCHNRRHAAGDSHSARPGPSLRNVPRSIRTYLADHHLVGRRRRRWPVKCRRGHHGVQTHGARAADHGSIQNERHARLRALSIADQGFLLAPARKLLGPNRRGTIRRRLYRTRDGVVVVRRRRKRPRRIALPTQNHHRLRHQIPEMRTPPAMRSHLRSSRWQMSPSHRFGSTPANPHHMAKILAAGSLSLPLT